MKYFAIMILIGFVVISSTSVVYGMWVPQSPEGLFEQSETVFVGTIQSVNVLEFERSNEHYVEENGVSRIDIENYTQALDEYTVDIEEFLKNPQTSNTITMLEATVSGVPGRSVSIGGFELGDRVLFYVPKIDGTNQYSPESFKIPKQCNAKSVLEQPRITFFNDFKIMQDGIEKNDNFTANKPIKFVYNKDMGTLEGKSFDVNIKISKITDNDWETAIQENIHTESKPCEWISTASWEFVPTAGRYNMWMNISEGNSTGVKTTNRGFTVTNYSSSQNESVFPHHGYNDWKTMPPLKQIESGILYSSIQCKDSLVLVQKYDGSPACVKEQSIPKLVERGWIAESNSYINGDCMTLDQSKSIAPFFKVSSYLPEGYSMKCSMSGTPYESYIIYHNKDVSEGWMTHYPEMVSDGAIFIHQTNEKNMIDKEKYATFGSAEQRIQNTYDDVMIQNPSLQPQLIRINGILAYAVDSCSDCGMQNANFADGTGIKKSTSTETTIKFIDEDGISYFLKAGIPLSELIKVAESLQ